MVATPVKSQSAFLNCFLPALHFEGQNSYNNNKNNDMKVNMILTVEWATLAVKKQPKKIQALPGNEPRTLTFAMARRKALSTDWAYQANWRAGHCEFVIHLIMMEMTCIEIYEMNHILNCG